MSNFIKYVEHFINSGAAGRTLKEMDLELDGMVMALTDPADIEVLKGAYRVALETMFSTRGI